MLRKTTIYLIPILGRVVRQRDELREQLVVERKGFPNGHFYSPVHSQDDLKDYDQVIKRSYKSFKKYIPGFNDKKLKQNFNLLKKYFKEFNYPVDEDKSSRYYIHNISYPITDALMLFSFVRQYKPKRIIEIGSGFTSALMMDVNEKYFNNKIKISFIEPYPQLLRERMTIADMEKYKIIAKGVQFVSPSFFSSLEKNDILFIDSTHVSKFNSDVNFEIFEILPKLKPGVIIHFHDTFEGFEYPLKWLNDGWAWNEQYLLRAFLMNNHEYEVLMMNNYFGNKYRSKLLKALPQSKEINGGSLWIRKTK